MIFFDSHCHLGDIQFASDIASVLSTAREEDVQYLCVLADSVEEGARVLPRFLHEQGIALSVGIHPHYADTYDRNESALQALMAEYPLSALGEMGLDYTRSRTSKKDQFHAFSRQITLASTASLPMVIHCRDAFTDLFPILDEQGYFSGVLHCFTGNHADTDKAIERGLLISFSGILTYSQSTVLRECAARVPEELLLIETDSPYLPPDGKRGMRNEPKNVRAVAEELARIRNTSVESIAEITTRNAMRFYNIDLEMGNK